MSIEKVRAMLWYSLPDNQDESYLYLCFLFNYLQENENLKWIVTADIEKETLGFINKEKLGKVLRALPTKERKKQTSRIVNGKKENIYGWNPKPFYSLLLSWAVEPITKEQLLDPNILKSLQYLGKHETSAVFHYNKYKAMCLSLLPNHQLLPQQEEDYYQSLWKERYGEKADYKVCNSLVRNLINYANYQPSKRMGIDHPCFVISNTKDDGYAIKSKQLLIDMGIPFVEDIKLDTIPPQSLSRLVAMVRYPFEDWHYSNAERKLEAHHVCKTRNCINPAHIILSYKPNHQKYHSAVGDDKHPTIANDFEVYPEVSVA